MKEPKIRFKEFEGEWEDHTLGDFGHISMCKRIFKNQTSPDGDIPFFKIGTFGYTPDAYISRKLYEVYRQLYPFPHKGDILISAAGTIGRTVEYMGEDAYYQDSNIVWLNHSNDIDNKFLKYLYSHTNWNNLEGATIKRLYNSILLSTKSNCPSLAEQQKIASFFTTIDAQISASTSRLASLKQINAASLQAMFPQEGETVPKLRFKGFEGEWENEKIGNFSSSFSGGTPAAGVSKYYGGVIPFIRSGEIHEDKTELFLTEKGYNNSSAKIVDRGTLLYALYGATSGDVAISKIKGAINQAILAIIPYKSVEKVFLANFLLCNKDKIVGELLQGGQGNLSGSLVKNIIVAYPSISEQRAIASYFTNLDRQITLQAQRLEKLKQIKAACLDKMFV